MIFIIGGHGFVGSGVTRFCRAARLEHEVITRDNYANMVGKQCDVLINANGNSKKFLAKEQPVFEFEASVLSVRRTLEEFKYDKYILFSSCDVYPDCSSPSTTGEDQTINVQAQSPYGFHKYLAEQCVQHRAPKWLVLRFGGFVGPGLKKNPIFDIISGGSLWLDPRSELQFMHTDGSARLVFDILKSGVTNQTINVCGKGLISLQEVLDVVGTDVSVKAGSPTVRYDVNIQRLSGLAEVPLSRSTVLTYVEEEAARRNEYGGKPTC